MNVLTDNLLNDLYNLIADRQKNKPAGSYTVSLLEGGVDRIGKKVIEEAGEVVIAAKNGQKAELLWELADLTYHSLVLMVSSGVKLSEVEEELKKRFVK